MRALRLLAGLLGLSIATPAFAAGPPGGHARHHRHGGSSDAGTTREHRPDRAEAPEPTAWRLPELAPRLPSSARITVLPVLFVPSDVPFPDLPTATDLLTRHLDLARAHYRELLGTTFEVAPGQPRLHLSTRPDVWFTDVAADTDEDRAHRVTAELFDDLGTDRYTTDHVLLVIYASKGEIIAGGGRTFNGAPGTGGGYVEMDLRSLMTDAGYPFQSTLVHELGHAFGMTHASCYGYDQQTNGSIMSYNPAHHSTGLSRSATPGGLNPEERLVLDLAEGVFPELAFDGAAHAHAIDLDKVSGCFFSPMAETIGALRDSPGVGFELFHDGRRVSTADATLYPRTKADQTCQWNVDTYPGVQVECRYNGQRFYPLDTP